MTARPARPPSSPANYPLSTGMHGLAMPRLQMPFWIESCKGIIASHSRVTPCARNQNQTKAAQTRSILTDTTSIKPHNAKPLQTGHDRQKDRSWSPEHATLIYSMAQTYTLARQVDTSGVLQHAGASLQHVHGNTGDRPVGLRCSAIPFKARTCIPALKFYVVEPINKSPSIN